MGEANTRVGSRQWRRVIWTYVSAVVRKLAVAVPVAIAVHFLEWR